MRFERFEVGDSVQTTMGVPRRGTVIKRFYGPFTDGSYRQPEDHEDPVYVIWNDGTRGWIDAAVLEEVRREK